MVQRYTFLFIFFFLIGCKIFDDSTDTEPDNLFKLSIEYNNERITDVLSIQLSWSEITIDSFKKIKITRFNEHRDPDSYLVGETDNGWITVASIMDEFATSWIDTVNDDAPFLYRVDYYDVDNNYRRAEELVTIRPTTHITIPTDLEDIKSAVESYIIDDGDTVYILPGVYESHSFSFGDKELSLIGTAGAEQTLLKWKVRMDDVEPLVDGSFISLSSGLVQGIGILHGYSLNGGGINASGESRIQQCIIRKNIASHITIGGAYKPDSGHGGGLHLSGQVSVENCIIDSNFASKKGSGIYVDEFANNVQIINCVLNVNDLYTESPNVSIENTIIAGVSPTIGTTSVLPTFIKYSHIGAQWTSQYPTNVVGEILFERLTGGPCYYLLPGSVCIDSGNPDSAFNDPDGSRNDIGAYGGPLGDW